MAIAASIEAAATLIAALLAGLYILRKRTRGDVIFGLLLAGIAFGFSIVSVPLWSWPLGIDATDVTVMVWLAYCMGRAGV